MFSHDLCFFVRSVIILSYFYHIIGKENQFPPVYLDPLERGNELRQVQKMNGKWNELDELT